MKCNRIGLLGASSLVALVVSLLAASCGTRAPRVDTAKARVVQDTVILASSGATRLRPEYVREALENPASDERVHAAMQVALRDNSEQARRDLIRAVELKFIHDPETSTLDLLGPDLSKKYRNFDWHADDYPGGPEGPNEDLAVEMVNALRSDSVRPERRANSGHDPVVRRSEATEEVWEYMLNEWVEVPEQENWKLNRHARESFLVMRDQARREGVELIIRSGHRDPARAAASAARTGNPYAVASFSSHSLGLAIDFQMSHGDLKFPETSTRPMSGVIEMRKSPVHKWLFLRGDDFGWYPYMHEPWHWEYNPEGFRPIFWQGFPGGAPEPPSDTE